MAAADRETGEVASVGGRIESPMLGRIAVLVMAIADTAKRGQRLLVIGDAMKMELAINSPVDGVVVDIAVRENAQIPEGFASMRVNPASAPQEQASE